MVNKSLNASSRLPDASKTRESDMLAFIIALIYGTEVKPW
jgi:hypothetical protein